MRKLKIALFLSLTINVAPIFMFAYKTYHNWFEMGVLKAPFRMSLFYAVPKEQGKIYFVGDSHTEAFELNELLHNQDVRNRGIWGDVSSNVLKRIDNVISAQPKKLFLMIGVNDICSGVSTNNIVSNVENLIKTSKTSIPGVEIYLESVLPTSQKILHSNESTVTKIQEVNSAYKQVCKKYSITYIDLFSSFVGSNGLRSEYSFDGLHLNGLGYLKLAELIKPFVNRK